MRNESSYCEKDSVRRSRTGFIRASFTAVIDKAASTLTLTSDGKAHRESLTRLSLDQTAYCIHIERNITDKLLKRRAGPLPKTATAAEEPSYSPFRFVTHPLRVYERLFAIKPNLHPPGR